jgi:hypothetical protein
MPKNDSEQEGRVISEHDGPTENSSTTDRDGEDTQARRVESSEPPRNQESDTTVELPSYPPPICDPEGHERYFESVCTGIANYRQRPLFVMIADSITPNTFLTITLWRKALSIIGAHSGFDVLLHSPGGVLSACYQIARTFAKFTKSWDALVPLYAASGATLISLGSANIILSDFAQLGPLDPQVISKRTSKFFYAERQSSLEAFQAVKYLRQSALETMNATMLYLLHDQGVAPQTAIDTASKLSVELTKPILDKIDPYDLGSFAQDNALAVDYSRRICQPVDSEVQAQRNARFGELVQKYTAHEFVIDHDEAKLLGLAVERPSDELEDLFEAFRVRSFHVTELIGLYLPANGEEQDADNEENCETANDTDHSCERETKYSRNA